LTSSGRRHPGIVAGPTRGHQPPVWAYLLELIVQEGSIEITADQQLLPHDADEFADRMVLRTETTHEAFQWLVRHNLVATRMSAGRHFASPDLGAVQDLLRRQHELELAGARASDLAALNYFRSRHVWVGLPWMGRVLGEERE
jgi:hypothetical protein